MAQLLISHKQGKLSLNLPYGVFINGAPVGLMRTQQVRVSLPAGQYDIRVQFGGALRVGKKGRILDFSLSGEKRVRVSEEALTCVDFSDKERAWNILFDIDLALWAIMLFVTIPSPWNLVYHILSDGFFLIWVVRLIIVRKKYYRLDVYTKAEKLG